MRILVVEDERKIANFIKKGLMEEHYAVDVAYDGEEGFLMAQAVDYDAIVLDIMLPRKSGMDFCIELRRRRKYTPILMLTAKDTVDDKVNGLDAGADDYLTKPFVFKEFLARIRALVRRDSPERYTKLQIGELVLDATTHEVYRSGKTIYLSNKEYSLLEYLMRHAGQVITRTQISEHIWDYDFDCESNVIDVYIRYLRKKIDEGYDQKLIHTVRGVGYKIKG
jgi:heavy metal response regulator